MMKKKKTADTYPFYFEKHGISICSLKGFNKETEL